LAKAELVCVQYLRGLAASFVVFHHARDQLPAAAALIPTQIGLAGVDLFFVISGFVMTYTAAMNRYSAGEFLARRTVRIVPLYWVVTAALALLLLFAPPFLPNSRFTLDSFVQSLLFIPHVNPGAPDAVLPMLKLGWTLNFEAFFYLCFALVLALPPARRTAILALGFVALVAAVSAFSPDWTPIQFWADPILFEFIFGCIVGVLFLTGALQKPPTALWLVLLLAATAGLIAAGFAPGLAPQRVLVWAIPCALILTACVALEQRARQPWRSRLLHFLGDASYSIYLVHAYVVVAFRLLWTQFALPTEGVGAPALFVALCIIAGIAAGCLAHVAVERPLTNAARRLVVGRRPAQA
jgi:exopolysaccharide production protein ExoZ